MRGIASAAALFLCALGWPVMAQTLQPFAVLAGPPDAPVEIEADSMTYGYDKKVLRLEGHVVARRGAGILRAGSGLYDREAGKLTLSGGVLGVQGRQVFIADAALVDVNARSAEFRAKTSAGTTDTSDMAVLYLKEENANPDAPKTGKNALILWGRTVEQREDGTYAAKDVILTPCDCAGEPDYELRADDAVLDGDRAHLSGTHLHFPHVTLPFFPLSLPLTNRQWGLLAPQFGFSGVAGFGLAQPLFLPLGDSYDVTLTPGFFTGGKNSAAGGGQRYGSAIGARNIKGPRLGAEFRYAPVAGTSGSLSFDLFYDADQHQRASPNSDPPLAGEAPSNDGRGLGGVRGVAHLLHRTETSAATFAVQGTVATDTMVVQDAEPTSIDRFTDFLRTDAGLWRARGATTVGIDSTFLQDVRILDANEPDRRLFGSERRTTFQRLPSAFAQVAPEAFGPFFLSLEAGAAEFAPFAGPDANEKSTGFAPTDLGAPGAQPLNAGDVARAPGLRADFAPRLAWSVPRTTPIDLRIDAGGRADGYVLYGYPDRDHARAYADAGILFGLPLERRFGGTLHRIEPQVELRAITPSLLSGGPPIGDPADAGGARYSSAIDSAQQNVFVGAPTQTGAASGVPSARRAYDEVDGAAPSTGAVEAVFSLDQALWTKAGKTAVRWLRLDLQQDVLFGSGGGGDRLGEGSATLGLQYAFAAFNGVVRYDWDISALSTISLSASAHDARSDEVHGSLLLLRGASSERLRAGIDELFAAARLAALPGSLVGSVGGGASAALPGNLRLAYEGSKFISPSNTIAQGQADMVHGVSLAYDTPCHCATVALGVAQPFHGGTRIGPPSVHFVLDLKSLGSFATF
jgi:LPS-assembly protein